MDNIRDILLSILENAKADKSIDKELVDRVTLALESMAN